jgi:acetyl-CoA acyltransferase
LYCAGGAEHEFIPMGGYLQIMLLQSRKRRLLLGNGIDSRAVAQQFKVSREDQDEFAYNSHMKALKHKLMVNLINKLFLSQ